MKLIPHWLRKGHHLLLTGIIGVSLFGILLPVEGASTIEKNALIVDVTTGMRRVKVERKMPDGTWTLVGVAYTDGRAGKVKLRLPSAAIALTDLRVSTSDEAPLSFISYLQNTHYKNFDQSTQQNGSDKSIALGDSVYPAGATTDTSGESVTVEESDIWKIDGQTLYYFNSLRGLQVLDLSDPAAPELTGRVRMPGQGEQFYLIDSTHLALLAGESWSGQGSVLVVNTADPTQPVITHELPLRGNIQESRLVGRILYVATTAYELRDATNNQSDYQQVTYLTRLDLSDPADPSQTAQYAQEGYATAMTATPEAFLLATRINRNTDDNGKDLGYWTTYSAVTVFAIGDPSAELKPAATVATRGTIDDKYKLNLKGSTLTTIAYEWRNGNTRRTLLETFNLTRFTPASSLTKHTLGKLADVPPAPTEAPPTLPPDLKPPVVVTPPPPPPPEPVLPNPADATRLAELELAPGESLFATRFDGDKAYVVTFLQKDPLFIIDLSNPAKPTISGKLDIPGYSTVLLPHNNRLIGIGIENQQVTVVLFDVSNPLKPTELQRIKIGSDTGYTWSEGNYDDKAVSFLPAQKLLMLPYQSYDWKNGTNETAMQLVVLNDTNNDGSFDSLTKAGTIVHSEAARRAIALDANTLVSISSRELITVDATDRSSPSILSTTTLAWSSDFIIHAGDHLVQIENGNASGYWSNSYTHQAIATITTTEAIDTPLAMIDLNVSSILGTAVKDNHLYIASVIPEVYPDNYATLPEPRPVPAPAKFVTSIYDLSTLPAMPLVGSVQQALSANDSSYSIGNLTARWLSTGDLLWYSSANYGYYGWDWCGTTSMNSGVSLTADFMIGRGGNIYRGASSSRLITVSVIDPAKPAILASLDLSPLLHSSYTYDPEPTDGQITDQSTVVNSVNEYFQDGFYFSGGTAWIAKTNSSYSYNWWDYSDQTSSTTHFVYAIPLSNPAVLVASESVPMPGRLLGVTATSSTEATLFSTRFVQTKIEWITAPPPATYTYPVIEGYNALQASLYDGVASYLTEELNVSAMEQGYWQDTKTVNSDLYLNIQQTSSTEANAAVSKLVHLSWDGQKFTRGRTVAFSKSISVVGLFDDHLVVASDGINLLSADQNGNLRLVANASYPFGVYGINWAQSALDFPTAAWIASGSYGAESITFIPVATLAVDSTAKVAKSRLSMNTAVKSSNAGWQIMDSTTFALSSTRTSADGVGKLDQRDWLYRANETVALTRNATDLGDGLHASTWLGNYYDELYPWVRHDDHGWLYAVPYTEGRADVDSFFFWQPALGWTWVGSDVYDYVYNFDRAAWLYYWPGSGANGTPRYFFNCRDDVWDWEMVNP